MDSLCWESWVEIFSKGVRPNLEHGVNFIPWKNGDVLASITKEELDHFTKTVFIVDPVNDQILIENPMQNLHKANEHAIERGHIKAREL